MMKKSSLFLLLVLFVLLMAACGGNEASSVPPRPVVQLHVGDQTYEEDIYSYCWPESADNNACGVNEAAKANPKTIVNVTAGNEVRFEVTGSEITPERFIATLLDGPGGFQDLLASTNGAYNASLPDGQYRVQVDVEYADVEGQQSYVSYVFGLNVEGVLVVIEPTITPTEPPTSTPTNTVEPTAIPTEKPAATATRKPTLQPTKVPPAAATEEVEPMTTEEAADTTPSAITGASPTVAALAVTPTQAVGPSATATIAPILQPTITPTTAASPTAEPPLVPDILITFAGRDYNPVGYQYCQRVASGERVCIEQPAEGTMRRIGFLRGAAAQLKIMGPRPDQVRLEYLSDTGLATGQPETRPGDNIILFSITPEPGTYIMAVRIQWGEDDATYFFRVSVTD